MDLGIPPLNIKITLESSPQKSTMLKGKLAVPGMTKYDLRTFGYGRFPKSHRVFLGRDPGTLKSDILSKKHPQLICSDLRLSNWKFEDWNYGNRPYIRGWPWPPPSRPSASSTRGYYQHIYISYLFAWRGHCAGSAISDANALDWL